MRQDRPADREPFWRPLVLRRADQGAAAAIVLVCLVAVAGYWVQQGGLRGRLIEIDRAQNRPVRFVVDVNSARWPELAQIPGIGETLARRIVETRERNGPFHGIDDLDRVPGVGPKTLERMKPYLRPLPDDAALVGS